MVQIHSASHLFVSKNVFLPLKMFFSGSKGARPAFLSMPAFVNKLNKRLFLVHFSFFCIKILQKADFNQRLAWVAPKHCWNKQQQQSCITILKPSEQHSCSYLSDFGENETKIYLIWRAFEVTSTQNQQIIHLCHSIVTCK